MGRDDSIDLSLKNIWRSWFTFRKGKRATPELHDFQYHLEENLFLLFQDLNDSRYNHGGYRKFIVNDNKRRAISVASVRDRVVHRLVYDHLVRIYDKTFIFDAWSCREGKGLLGAIERIQIFLKKSEYCGTSWVWKCDVKKFFDSVDQRVLLKIISRRVSDEKTYDLLKSIIYSYSSDSDMQTGMPIGNLTSQIFANIYLNELDRFIKHTLKARAYLRYGDDFVVVENNPARLEMIRRQTIRFLDECLKLQVNRKIDKIMKTSHGLKILGVEIWPYGRTLSRRNQVRLEARLQPGNVSSYRGILRKHSHAQQLREFDWLVLERCHNNIEYSSP